MTRNGAWGYAMAREIREGSRTLPDIPRVTKRERDEAIAAANALEADVDERDEAFFEAAFEKAFDAYAEWVGQGRP